MEQEFDILKIVRGLRNLEIILKEQKMANSKLKLLAENHGFNVIALDSDDEKQDTESSDGSEAHEA